MQSIIMVVKMIIIIIAVMSIARYFNDKAEHTVLFQNQQNMFIYYTKPQK